MSHYYYAVWVNGLISHRLAATTASEAIAELRGTPAKARRAWVDTVATDLDDDTGTDLSSITDPSQAMLLIDAVLVYSPERVEGSWQIWALE